MVLALLGVVITGLVLIGLDVYARSRVERSAGTNWQGYRGPVAGRKAPGEIRIAVLGGSTAFGYGVTANHAFPAYLQRMLNEKLDGLGGRARKVTVLNLSYNNESAVCFASTLASYAYLRPDIVLLYSGINDKPFISYYRRPEQCHRNKSVVFRLTGYLPILPLVVQEKYFQLRYGTVEEGYLEWSKRNRRRAAARRPVPVDKEALKEAGYARYENYVTSLIDRALERGQAGLFVTQPFGQPGTYREWQQARLRRTFEQMYAGSSRFHYVSLGELFGRRADPEYTIDGMHFTPKGNAKVARALVEPCLELMGRLTQ
jgi:lysophospholipase L1-like esterase